MRMGFGSWQPDSAGVDMRSQNGEVLLADARGVYPGKGGFTPVPSLAQFASFVLPARCVGAFVGHTTAGGHVLFVGTATKLYKFDATSGWVDYTRTVGGNYAVPSGEYWTATQFGSKVIFCNAADDPQTIDIDTGATAFTALAGTPPKSRYVGVVGDFVVLACQVLFPQRVINSAINDTTGWTVGTNLCDQQDFPDGENITGFAGGEFGWIVQEHAIRRMIFQPGFDQAFRFERVEREHGNAGFYAMVPVGDKIFFLADDGFYKFSAQEGLVPIGHLRVNDWFRANSDGARTSTVLALTDPYAPRVYWAFSNPSALYLSHLLIYDWQQDEWAYVPQTAQFWARQTMTGTTLEGLDPYGSIDGSGLMFSLDDRVWQGGQPVIAGISAGGTLGFLNGVLPQQAVLLTGPLQLTPSARSFVRSVYPLGVFNDASIQLRVGKRERTQDTVNYSIPVVPSTRSGIARVRSSGRVHQFELTLGQTTGIKWEHAQGLDIEAVPDGLQ